MKLIQVDDRIVAACSYEQREVPKKAGFRWDPQRRHWWTSSDDVASRLAQHAEGGLRARLELVAARRAEVLESSRAMDAAVDVPAPEGLSYRGYQKAALAYAAKRPRVLIADEMGLGKTIEAIGVVNADPAIRRVLVTCPASLRLNWKRELERWLVRPTRIAIANGAWPAEADVVICNYELLKKHHDQVRATEWDLLVLDESQYVKNQNAQRTWEVVGRPANEKKKQAEIAPITARREIWMTGTPILNRPVELWTTLHRLAPEEFDNFWKFTRRYCGAYQNRYGWDVSGASNLDELQEKLRSLIMIRRLKKDVLTELPPKRRQVIEIPAGDAESAVRVEREAWTRHEDQLELLRAEAELAKASEDPAVYELAVEALKEAAQVAFTEMSAFRHATALAKAPEVIEHAQQMLEGGCRKLIIFAHHLDVIEDVVAGLSEYGPVKLTGEMNANQKQASVDRFQNDPATRVFVGSIRAAGLGITLTAASDVVFAELDWTPAIVTQAEDRAHRIGQTESLLVQHLVLEGSLDATMAKTLVSKQEVIDSALDDAPSPEPILPGDVPATLSATRKAIADAASTLTPEEVSKIHHDLRRLAGTCDGAVALDGHGFNKLDQRIGHELANRVTLTPKQAALGQKILVKYRKQLGY